MARESYYDDRPRRSAAPLVAGALFLFGLAAALYVGLPLAHQWYAAQPQRGSAPAARPTERPMSPAVIRQYQDIAPGAGLGVEDHAAQQVEANPPAQPAPAEPGIAPGAHAPQAPAAYDPLLGGPPLPTAPSLLTAEQQQAVAETDAEANLLTSHNSTLTGAQQLAETHDAEWNVRELTRP